MNKGKVARLAGFAGALGLTTVLVTTAVQGTGAYFTSSVPGTLTGTTGHLEVKSNTTELNFGSLNPGEYQTKDISFWLTSNSTTDADIWLVFDPNSAQYGAFTGAKDSAGTAYSHWAFTADIAPAVKDGGMGQYGHFQVLASNGAQLFNSYNLQLPNVSDAMGGYGPSQGDNGSSCTVDQWGHGGSNYQHVKGAGTDVPECGVPAAIRLQQNLTIGQGAVTAKLTFGVTGKMSDQDTAQPGYSIPFKIVATQPGQYPLVTNGSNKLTDPQNVGQGQVGTNW